MALNSFPILLVALSLLLAAALVLLLTGLRTRRTGDTPFCRRCRYNLTGLAGTLCPECGADLSHPKSTVIGRRKIRRGRVIAGATLLALILGAVTTAAIGQARKIDWYAHYPASWILADLNSTNPARTGKAIKELHRRLKVDDLSPAHTSQFIEFCLARQAEGEINGPLYWSLSQCLLMMDERGAFSEDQKLLYLQNMGVPTLEVRPRVLVDQACPVRLGLMRFGSSRQYSFRARLLELSCDAADHIDSDWIASCTMGGSVWAQGGPHQVKFSRAGEYELTCRFEVYTFAADDARIPFDDAPAVPEERALASRTRVVTRRVQVLDGEPPDFFRTVSSPEIDAAIKRLVSVSVKLRTPGALEVCVERTQTPVSLAMNCFIQIDEELEQLDVPLIYAARPGVNTGRTAMCWIRPRPTDRTLPETVTVILKSSRKVAETTTDIFEIWDGELRFENIPVQPTKAQPSASSPTAP